jgi:acetate kinase
VQRADVFVYRAGRELGSLAAALGGLEALVFTAAIGEHAPSIRARICRAAAWLGIRTRPPTTASDLASAPPTARPPRG